MKLAFGKQFISTTPFFYSCSVDFYDCGIPDWPDENLVGYGAVTGITIPPLVAGAVRGVNSYVAGSCNIYGNKLVACQVVMPSSGFFNGVVGNGDGNGFVRFDEYTAQVVLNVL